MTKVEPTVSFRSVYLSFKNLLTSVVPRPSDILSLSAKRWKFVLVYGLIDIKLEHFIVCLIFCYENIRRS